MTKSALGARVQDSAAGATPPSTGKRRWSTPVVIVSALSRAETGQNGFLQDGTNNATGSVAAHS